MSPAVCEGGYNKGGRRRTGRERTRGEGRWASAVREEKGARATAAWGEGSWGDGNLTRRDERGDGPAHGERGAGAEQGERAEQS